tara:strand:- start:163 stop:543 length:381 start_codon:yes stop_codon:yes gene_type:complete
MSFVNSDSIPGHPLSGSNKMVPAVKSSNIFPYAESPADSTSGSFVNRGARPVDVYVVNNRSADIFLCFQPDKIATQAVPHANPSSDWINFGQLGVGLHKDLHPVAWSGSHASSAAGDIIFIYKGDQ